MKYLLIIISFLGLHAAYGQPLPEFEGKDTGAMIKASYLYNFSKLIDWPSSYKSGNFVISIMGGGNLHQELVKRYNEKQIGSQQIEIRKVSKTVNISPCHVLYVGREHSDILQDISNALKDHPTLIIANDDKALELGAALNFTIVESQLKFELNIENATSRNLFVGSTIKSLAHKIRD